MVVKSTADGDIDEVNLGRSCNREAVIKDERCAPLKVIRRSLVYVITLVCYSDYNPVVQHPEIAYCLEKAYKSNAVG